MSALLRLAAVEKRFGATTALAGVTLEIGAGEFVTLLGPSGCGKTTLLRIVAGFESPSVGRVELEGNDVTRLPSHRRPVNTVFQRYLLFPHLDVFENVAFGLRVSGCPKREIAPRVRAALELVRLSDLERRRADQLSGGQAQRISLARALVNRPRLLLLDEPLSALDLKVRLEMQAELRRIHRETGATFLYVTHDQQEAMSLSDRVVVMSEGRAEQVGAPDEVYHRPASVFVAKFVGDANVVAGEVVGRSGELATVQLRGTDQTVEIDCPRDADSGWVVLRPEILRLERTGQGMAGRVVDVAFLGSSATYRVDVDGVEMRVHEMGSDIRPRFALGDQIKLQPDPGRCIFLADPERPSTRTEGSAVQPVEER